MFSKNILLVFLSYGVVNVRCKTQTRTPCALDDHECTTVAADPLYSRIVKGIPDLGIPNSEPLHQDVIFGFVRDMNYTLTDAYLHGMKECHVQKHRLFVDQLRWTFTLHCPKLVMKSNYDVTGFIGGNYIEGKGLCKIIDVKYHMVLSGRFELFNDIEGKSHMRITYFDFDQLEVLEKVKYELKNLFNGDQEKSEKMHKYLNNNWKHVSDTTHYPTMYAFMGKLLENLNIFLLKVPADEIFYKYV